MKHVLHFFILTLRRARVCLFSPSQIKVHCTLATRPTSVQKKSNQIKPNRHVTHAPRLRLLPPPTPPQSPQRPPDGRPSPPPPPQNWRCRACVRAQSPTGVL